MKLIMTRCQSHYLRGEPTTPSLNVIKKRGKPIIYCYHSHIVITGCHRVSFIPSAPPAARGMIVQMTAKPVTKPNTAPLIQKERPGMIGAMIANQAPHHSPPMAKNHNQPANGAGNPLPSRRHPPLSGRKRNDSQGG